MTDSVPSLSPPTSAQTVTLSDGSVWEQEREGKVYAHDHGPRWKRTHDGMSKDGGASVVECCPRMCSWECKPLTASDHRKIADVLDPPATPREETP